MSAFGANFGTAVRDWECGMGDFFAIGMSAAPCRFGMFPGVTLLSTMIFGDGDGTLGDTGAVDNHKIRKR